jgi:hypothetical protein
MKLPLPPRESTLTPALSLQGRGSQSLEAA